MIHYLTVSQTQDVLDQFGFHRTTACIRQWCERQPGIGIKRAGRWFIDRDLLLSWLCLDGISAGQEAA